MYLEFSRKKLPAKLSPEHNEFLLHAIETTKCEHLRVGNRKTSYLKQNADKFKVSGDETQMYVSLKNSSKFWTFNKNGPKAQHPFMKPFFDGSDIHLEPKVPLSGIGLMHYTNDDSCAGLIVPYVKTLRYRHIEF